MTQVNGISNAIGVAINDTVSFAHTTGLVTRSKILDHYDINYYTGVDVPVLSYRVVINGVSANIPGFSPNALFGVQGPGDKIIAWGFKLFISLIDILSFL